MKTKVFAIGSGLMLFLFFNMITLLIPHVEMALYFRWMVIAELNLTVAFFLVWYSRKNSSHYFRRLFYTYALFYLVSLIVTTTFALFSENERLTLSTFLRILLFCLPIGMYLLQKTGARLRQLRRNITLILVVIFGFDGGYMLVNLPTLSHLEYLANVQPEDRTALVAIAQRHFAFRVKSDTLNASQEEFGLDTPIQKQIVFQPYFVCAPRRTYHYYSMSQINIWEKFYTSYLIETVPKVPTSINTGL